jgi:hypothetical protein
MGSGNSAPPEARWVLLVCPEAAARVSLSNSPAQPSLQCQKPTSMHVITLSAVWQPTHQPLLVQSTREVEGLVFRMANGVSQLKKLVDALGGARDTVAHRQRLADLNQKVQTLAHDIKDKVTALNQEPDASPALQAKSKKLLQVCTSVVRCLDLKLGFPPHQSCWPVCCPASTDQKQTTSVWTSSACVMGRQLARFPWPFLLVRALLLRNCAPAEQT